jgi:hypothetical protein
MQCSLPLIIAIPIVIAAGYVHGRWIDRWSPAQAVEAATAKLAAVPTTLGDWQGRLIELDQKTIDRAGIAGYVMRRYEHGPSGTAVSVLLVCGRPGPIAAHTPEVCYGGAGFEPLGESAQQAIRPAPAGPPAEFLTAVFGKPNAAVPTYLRIFWSWNGGEGWETSDSPRLRFARYPSLYKLYIVREMATADGAAGDDPSLAFVKDLLPALDRALF